MCENASSTCLPPDLLDGIAVFIDDEVDKKDTEANKLKQQIEGKNIPLILRDKIPNSINDFVKHLYGVSFIILDWKFLSSQSEPEQIAAGVHIPEDVRTGATIEFLEQLLKATYCPIFIISQESVTSIQSELNKQQITKDGMHPRIFIHGKKELSNGQLFSKLNEWIEKRSVTYVLKTWEKAARKAKLWMFTNLENKHSCWPRVLWKTFGDDHTNQSNALSETICNIFSNNLIANTYFESEKIKSGDEICSVDVRSVLEAERFMTVSEEMSPAPGDIFKTENEGYYLLNIRAQCNLLHIQNPDLYCVRGTILDESKIQKTTIADSQNNDKILFFRGQLHGHEDIVYIPFILEGKILGLDFKQFKIKSYNTVKSQRVGRLLPPFITKVQQLFSSYMIREGLPAIPDEAIFSGTTTTEPAGE